MGGWEDWFFPNLRQYLPSLGWQGVAPGLKFSPRCIVRTIPLLEGLYGIPQKSRFKG